MASDRSGHRTSEQQPLPSQSVTDSGHGRKMRQTTGRQQLTGGVPTPGPAEFKLPQPQTGPERDSSFARHGGRGRGFQRQQGSRAARQHQFRPAPRGSGQIAVRDCVGREPAGPGVNCQTNSSLVRPAQRHGSGFQVTPGGTNKGGPHGNVSSGQHHGVHVRLQSGAAIGQERARPRVPK